MSAIFNYFVVKAIYHLQNRMAPYKLTTEKRLLLLDHFSKQVSDCYHTTVSEAFFIALQDMIERFSIPEIYFQDIIESRKQDLYTFRYSSFEELLDYCKKAANAMGRIWLVTRSYENSTLYHHIDELMTAMQLTDIFIDTFIEAKLGRIYLPQEDLLKFNCSEQDVIANKTTDNFRALLSYEIERTEQIFFNAKNAFNYLSKNDAILVKTIYNASIGRLKLLKQANYDIINFEQRVSLFNKIWWMISALY